jgi:Ca2+-binding RTX toxin-like protein
MTKPHTPAQNSRKPALSQAAEERKLRSDAERDAARGLPTSVLLMGLAGGAVAASGRLPQEKAGSAAQDATAQALQDPVLPGAVEAADASLQLASAAAQASVVDGQALQRIVADLVTEAASVAMPNAGQAAVQGATEGAALTEGAAAEAAAEAAAAESAAAQAAQVAVQAGEAAMAAAGAQGAASLPVLLAQAQVPAASAGAASSSAATAAGTGAGAATGTAAAAAGTAAAAGAAISTAALVAVGAVVVGAAVASSGGSGSDTPDDKTAPTLTITDDKTGTVNAVGGNITYTFTFSEAVTGFTVADVTVANGTKGTFTAVSSTVYTLVVTPTAGFEGNVTVDVAASAAIDAANNASTAAAQSVQAVDTKVPTATITLSDSALKIGETATVTITFSEAVSGFDLTDLTSPSGALSNLSAATTNQNGTVTYTATFTPTANIEDTTNIVSLATSYGDVAGNTGTAATSANYVVDTKVPTATITLSDSALKIGETATVTITFSEAVSGFDLTDLTSPNGALSNLSAATTNQNGTVTYTATFTPTVDIEDTTNLVSLATSYGDVAGNTGTAATSANYAVDTNAPTFVSMEVHSNGGGSNPGTIDLVYSEPMAGASLPLASAFTVTINGVSRTATGVSADGNKLTLTFAPDVITAGALNLTVRFDDPTPGDDATAVQDAAGNDAASLDITSGVVADGYIRGAQMYLDGPDGLIPLAGVVTDDFGNFFLPADSNLDGYALVAVGGVNIDTGLPNTTPLKAPAGSTTINPLTTLVQAVMDQAEEQGQPLSAEAAATQVAGALGLVLPDDKNLTTYDPLAATDDGAVAAQKAAAQVATLATLAAEGKEGESGAADAAKVMSNLATVISNAAATSGEGTNQAVSLSDASVLTQALQAVEVTEERQVLLVEANTAIGQAQDITAISNTQSQFIDRKAPDAPIQMQADSVTRDDTPAVTVKLNVTSTDGGAAVKGDTVVLLNGTTEVGRVELSQADIDAGQVVIDTSALGEGSHTLQAKVVDKAGNTGNLSGAHNMTVDVTGPQATLNAATDNLAVGASTTLTLTFSEAVTGLSLSDLQVTGGGALSNLSAPQTVDGQQVYTVTYTAPTSGGAGAVQLTAASYTDAAGNQGAVSNEVDLAVVNPPVVTIISVGGADEVISGQAGDKLIQGTALVQYGLVTLEAANITLGTATVTNGRWSYTLTEQNLLDLGDGEDFTLTASQTHTVGNAEYTGISEVAFAIDTTESTLGFTEVIADDDIINIAERGAPLGVAITGTAEAGARVELNVGGVTRVLVASADTGDWSYTLTNADYRTLAALQGGPSVTAVAVDAAGNRSEPQTKAFAIDTTAPTLGLIRLVDLDDTGTKADGRTSNPAPSIEFTAEQGAELSVDIKTGTGDFTPLAGATGTATGALQSLALGTELADGTYVVRLKAVDAALNETVRTATIVIDGTAPGITSGPTATGIAENSGPGQVVYSSAATDASMVSYSLKTGGDAAAFVINERTGQVRLTANPNFEAKSSYAFTVVATDAAFNASEQAVTLQIQDVNEAPTAVVLTSALAQNRIDENTPTTSRVKVADIAITDDALGTETVTLTGADAAAFEVFQGALYLKANTALDFEAKSSLAVTVNAVDPALSGSTPVTASYSLSVQDVNEAPTSISLSATSVAENGSPNATVATLTATDPDGTPSGFAGPFTFSLVAGTGDADNGKFTTDGASLKLTNPADFEAQTSYAVRLRVTDSGGQSFELPQTITVSNVNEAPVIDNPIGDRIVARNVAQSGAITVASGFFKDPDAGDALSFTATGLPQGLSLSTTGVLEGTATQLTTTPASVTITATDKAGLAVSQTFALSVVDAPAVTTLTSSAAQVQGGATFTITAALSEPVFVPLGSQPTLTLDVGGQSVTATYSGPSSSGAPVSSLLFSATAPAGANDATVTVSAFNPGSFPLLGQTTNQPLTSPVNQTVSGFIIDSAPPVIAGSGAVAVDYAENGTVAVRALGVTDATALSFSLAGSDADKFSITDGALAFKSPPDSEANGSAALSNVYVVEITATDAVGLSSKQTVTVNVTNVNDNPVVLSDANGGANTVVENAAVGTAVGITALGTDADSLATVQYSLSNDAGGRFAIDPVRGVVTLAKASALDHQTSPIHKITVLATSSDGSTNSLVDLEIAVTPIPIATVVYSKPANIDALFEAAVFSEGSSAVITTTSIPVTSGDGKTQVRFIGTGFAWTGPADGNFQPTGGTVTRMEFDSGDSAQARTPAATLDGLNFNLVALSNAIDAAGEGDGSQLNALFSSFRVDVTGSTGNDSLGGDQWNDTIKGGEGNDTLTGSPGDDSLDGGNPAVSGNDLVDYRSAPGAVTVNLKTGVATTGAWGTDSLTGIEGVLGSAFDDSIVGSDSTTVETEIFVGGLGNDTIDGGAGFDIVSYDWDNTQAVNVDLSTPTGTATGNGIGTDTLINIEGVIGSSQADNLKGGAGDDWFRPQGGNDTVDGGAGNDRVNYDRASGAVTVNLATGTSSGANGVDTLINIENLRGSGFGDSLTGSAGNNDIQGRDGNDTISGLDGNDSLNGENGNDSLLGGNGADTLIGGAGDDTLDGGAQLTIEDNANFSNEFDIASYLAATAGVTVNLGVDGRNGFARSAVDTVSASIGTDVLHDIELVVGSNFNDSIMGSDRRVVEIFRANKGNDTIQGGTANDQGTNLVDYRSATGGGVNVNLATGSVTGADGTDTLVGTFHGVIGSEDVDALTGGGGDDFLDGRLGNDIIDGGGGNDRVAYNTASGGVTVNLAAGTVTGAAGNDVLTSIEHARGSEHADTLIGSDIANDLQGRAGDDNIQGAGGNDTIHGGAGSDTIDGGDGQDLARFSGLFSPDRYVVAIATNGVVTITDNLAGGDGVDVLSNVERFEFSDGRYKVNAGGTGLVADVTSLDDLNPAGTAQAPQVFNASSGAFNLTDDATRTNYTVIEGYGADDTLRFLGLTSAELLSIGNVGSDVELLVNNDGVTSTVILSGVVTDQQTLIYDIASFNALPVGDLLNIFQN